VGGGKSKRGSGHLLQSCRRRRGEEIVPTCRKNSGKGKGTGEKGRPLIREKKRKRGPALSLRRGFKKSGTNEPRSGGLKKQEENRGVENTLGEKKVPRP